MSKNISVEELFEDLTPTRVLISILATIKEVYVPMQTIVSAMENERQLQVDYNPDSQSFIFKLREDNE